MDSMSLPVIVIAASTCALMCAGNPFGISVENDWLAPGRGEALARAAAFPAARCWCFLIEHGLSIAEEAPSMARFNSKN